MWQPTVDTLSIDSGNTADTRGAHSHTNSKPLPCNQLRDCMQHALNQYFSQFGPGENIANIYGMVLAEVEAPFLKVVLIEADGILTQAAKILGISRGTLRKKLKYYQLSFIDRDDLNSENNSAD